MMRFGIVRNSLLVGMMTGALTNTQMDAQVTLPAIISNHMVVQADSKVPLWGKASGGAAITASFNGKIASTHADPAGYWQLDLPPMTASDVPLTLTITEKKAVGVGSNVTIQDVLVGEVWIAGGQSNMAYGLDSMQGKEKYVAAATNPQIRLFTVKHNTSAEPMGMRPGLLPGDVDGKWELSAPKTAAAFSAVAYLFASELQGKLHKPVGVISSNWGGTPIQTWMSHEAFASDVVFQKYLDESAKAVALHRQLTADPENDAKYKADWQQWRKDVGETYDAAMKAWNLANEAGNDAGPRPTMSRPEPRNPDPTGIPLGGYRPMSPSVCWNAMYAPLLPYAMRGALWYQGEANVSGYKEYGPLLRSMVLDWRRQFANSDLDFLVVQLPANGANDAKRNLAHMREAQASVLTLPHTGLAVTFDVGDPGNVHPASKVDVANRLTQIALAKTYGRNVPYTGPVFESANADGDTFTVTFSHVAGNLVIAQTPWLSVHTVPFPLDHVIGFEIAGDDKVFAVATAIIAGRNKVLLKSEAVPHPRYVRYAFDESPRANLYDEAGLPTAPFRTDSDR